MRSRSLAVDGRKLFEKGKNIGKERERKRKSCNRERLSKK